MLPPPELATVLDDEMVDTWEAIAPVLPDQLYLAGGTGLAVHLRHRVSRDLDFFYHHAAVDLEALRRTLAELGPLAATDVSPGTLNALFSKTRLQFLHADEVEPQTRLEPTTRVAGLNVAGIGDILAMKLNVIAGRGELRDYYDLMRIETDAGRSVEEGLSLFLARYDRPPEPYLLEPIVRALGHLADVDEDELLPVGKAEIERYWRGRQPEVIRSLARFRT